MSKYEEFAFDIAQVLRKHNIRVLEAEPTVDVAYLVAVGEDKGNDLRYWRIENSGNGVVVK